VPATLICSNCGTENEAGRKFCSNCGTRLASACPVCGTVNAPTAKFCGECGNALGSSAQAPMATAVAVPAIEPATQTDEGPVAERRLVSVLFTDLVGFTTLSERRDAEDTRELLSTYFELARDIVTRYGGVIEKFIGDAVMAVWGTPTAHEDDAERAVRAALELVAAVGAMDVGDTHLQARAGVLTGEAAVTIGATSQGMVAGDLVNTASRLQSVAPPGSVLVGEGTHRAASGAITFEPAGDQVLKGKEAPVPAWRAIAVVARRGGEGRAATLEPPFVGRDEELRLLKDVFHATTRERKPRLVTVVGQAGIGKSRLGWELEKYLDGVVETAYWHEGRSPAYGEGISYWALAEMVRARAGIAEGDDAETASRRLAEVLTRYVDDPSERTWIEPRIAGLLGLAELPNDGREQLFAAWRTFFERLADKATVILVFWDLQWADQGLLDFIEHLLAWARTSPIFAFAEARPELFDRRPGWGSGVRSAASINLEPLTDPEMHELLDGLVPGLPEHASRAIVDRAEGIPLYAVETLRMLIDQGVLRPQDDHYALAVELRELAIPETLHALIAARLDALQPHDRETATVAAVLGLSFTLPALRAVLIEDDSELLSRLDRLIRHQLLILDADPRSPERGQYRFVQAVVREVAYQSLAKRERRARHLAAARYYEGLGEDELAGVLASHYLDAYRATPPGPEAEALGAQARVALKAAAERAAALHSQAGAVSYLELALEVTPDVAERAVLHERAAGAAWLAARMKAALDHARAAEEIYAEAGDRLGVLRGKTLQATAYLASHGDRPAADLLRAALAEIGDHAPAADIAQAESELARALMLGGALAESVQWADRVLGSLSVADPRLILETLITKGSVLHGMGAIVEAEVVLRGALAVAERLGEVASGLRARNNLRVCIEWTNIGEAQRLCRDGYEIARRFGLRTWVLQNAGAGLWSGREIGAWDDWVAEIATEIRDASEWYVGFFRAEEAVRLAYRGEVDAAQAIHEEVQAYPEIRESAQATAAFHNLLGDIMMARGRWTDAFEASKQGSGDLDSIRNPTMLLAAAAADDQKRLDAARANLPAPTPNDAPLLVGIRLMGESLDAMLNRRWEETRLAYLDARRALEPIPARLTLARFNLAIGHGAQGRFAEADDALGEAKAFFHERGADAYVATYLRRAVSPAASSVASRSSRKSKRTEPAPAG